MGTFFFMTENSEQSSIENYYETAFEAFEAKHRLYSSDVLYEYSYDNKYEIIFVNDENIEYAIFEVKNVNETKWYKLDEKKTLSEAIFVRAGESKNDLVKNIISTFYEWECDPHFPKMIYSFDETFGDEELENYDIEFIQTVNVEEKVYFGWLLVDKI